MDHHLIYLFHRWSHGYAQQWRIQHSNRNMENQKKPNHTDLVRQVTNWQVATLADLSINAQNTAIFPFNLVEAGCQQSMWAASPRSAECPPGEPPGAPSASPTFWHRRRFAHLPFGPWTFTLGTQEQTRNLCFSPGPSEAMFLLKNLSPALDGDRS